MVIYQFGKNAPDTPPIQEIRDDEGDIVITINVRLVAGAGAKQDHFFHVWQRALDVASLGREARSRCTGKDFGHCPHRGFVSRCAMSEMMTLSDRLCRAFHSGRNLDDVFAASVAAGRPSEDGCSIEYWQRAAWRYQMAVTIVDAVEALRRHPRWAGPDCHRAGRIRRIDQVGQHPASNPSIDSSIQRAPDSRIYRYRSPFRCPLRQRTH